MLTGLKKIKHHCHEGTNKRAPACRLHTEGNKGRGLQFCGHQTAASAAQLSGEFVCFRRLNGSSLVLNRVRDKSQHSRLKVAESDRNVEFVLHLAELVLDHSSNYEGTGAGGGGEEGGGQGYI